MQAAAALLALAGLLALPAAVAARPPRARGPGCPDRDALGLRTAAASAGIRVGVAAAPGEPEPTRLVAQEFDALSAEGEFLWSVIHPAPGVWNFDGADRFIHFSRAEGLTTTVTHFVWDQVVDISTTPAWVLAIDDPEELREVMREHLRTITERYGGAIDRWIAVNEPFEYLGTTLYPNHFHRVLGPDYVEQVFRMAREEAPRSELWLNEILVEYQPAKAAALVAFVANLVAKGVPVDGVSLQGHLFGGAPDWELVRDTLAALGHLGVKTAFSEVDAPVAASLPDRLEVQAESMARLVESCLEVAACDSVTWWGLHDGVSWLNWFLGPDLVPLLFTPTLERKPGYFAAREMLWRGRPVLTGRRLLLRGSGAHGRPSAMRVVSLDPLANLARGDGSPDDPVLHGGELRVWSSSGSFDARYELRARDWRYRGREGGCRGYEFRSGGPIRLVSLSPQAGLRIQGRGEDLEHDLSRHPGEVNVVLRVGERRHCMSFGGRSRFRPGRAFRASDAPAPQTCPAAP